MDWLKALTGVVGIGGGVANGMSEGYAEARAYADRKKAQQAEEARQQEMLKLHQQAQAHTEQQDAWKQQEAARDNMRSLATTPESKIQLEQSLSPGFQPPTTPSSTYAGPFPTTGGTANEPYAGPFARAPVTMNKPQSLADYQFGVAQQGAETAQQRHLALTEAQHGKDAALEQAKLDNALKVAGIHAQEGVNTKREEASIATKQALAARLEGKTPAERVAIMADYNDVLARGGSLAAPPKTLASGGRGTDAGERALATKWQQAGKARHDFVKARANPLSPIGFMDAAKYNSELQAAQREEQTALDDFNKYRLMLNPRLPAVPPLRFDEAPPAQIPGAVPTAGGGPMSATHPDIAAELSKRGVRPDQLELAIQHFLETNGAQ